MFGEEAACSARGLKMRVYSANVATLTSPGSLIWSGVSKGISNNERKGALYTVQSRAVKTSRDCVTGPQMARDEELPGTVTASAWASPELFMNKVRPLIRVVAELKLHFSLIQ